MTLLRRKFDFSTIPSDTKKFKQHTPKTQTPNNQAQNQIPNTSRLTLEDQGTTHYKLIIIRSITPNGVSSIMNYVINQV
ncbi:hypothetical protein M9399_00540 [Candidatus Blochmanniella camponoti]|uniref:Uncharacterized protein n=1 Tax=Candidatus Blochmanniella camponoti TaxID=108080 RepID=A0AAE9L6W1_9ENTR|nr:hypothetical protein [Candidatus Blochmannia herculeanus]URJ24362.1 hypothetical protein M9404_02380 [Candidatus Blochmannia herculeanus]URJ27028.1 hypothetical protein M9399_00540 [Candidatus Blochmannia herculeanus]URJ27716.1 hypothetical protein M9394_01020 [Candidatus Blochmannia herculeanus]